ncbi:uncharacterized protein LOC114866737 [Betta splendens]|uniref:Uncharacterized protein LOC114866737 n=1 Tax=Betta splendens TaxID=158456 RepID=A0A9W2X9Q6_BETSP|nr:uncharacterized protein LOC114866737 [Betta splendens]
MASLMFASCLTCLLVWNKALATDSNVSIRQDGGLILADAGGTVTLRCFYECNTQAVFHCIFTYKFEFAEGVTVSVKGSDSNVPALVHQSVFGSIQPGGSVTLNCLVQTGTCDGQHSVYWFKDTGEARPGIIYTHRDRNDHFSPVSKQNVFGNGTTLDFEDVDESFMLVCVLSGASVFTTLLVVFLAYPAYRTYKANGCQCTDFKERSQPSSAPNAEVYEDAENLNYGAMKRNQMSRSARQRGDTWSECVYSHVRM